MRAREGSQKAGGGNVPVQSVSKPRVGHSLYSASRRNVHIQMQRVRACKIETIIWCQLQTSGCCIVLQSHLGVRRQLSGKATSQRNSAPERESGMLAATTLCLSNLIQVSHLN